MMNSTIDASRISGEKVPEQCAQTVRQSIPMTLSETAEWLRAHDNILILLHTHPDGDTLGSGIALREMLRLLGKTAYCVCPSVIPHRLAFIPGGSMTRDCESLLIEQLPPEFVWDSIVSVDVASPSQMGEYETQFGEWGKVDLAIDHHGTNSMYAKRALVIAEMAACAEIVFDIGRILFGWDEHTPVPQEIAAPLYAGLNTDSGSFKFNTVTEETHRRAALMLASGIDHAKIASRLYGSRPMSEVMAAKAAYADLRFFFDGQVSLVSFTEETMEEYHLRDEDISDVITLIRGIQGVKVAVHIKPRGKNTYKVSLRCDPGLDVAAVCARFGGGGHICAAGCDIEADEVRKAEEQILSAIGDALRCAEEKEAGSETQKTGI